MTEKEILKNALQLLSSGRKEEAIQVLINIYSKTNDNSVKLDTILGLITSIDRLKNDRKLIDMCNEGIHITSVLNKTDIKAYLMASKAKFLMDEISHLQYKKSKIVLSPGWIGFATESDKNEYEAISKKIENIENEIKILLKEASTVADSTTDTYLAGHIFLILGEIFSNKYLNNKLEFVVQNPKIKWARYHIIKCLQLDKYLTYNREQRYKINECSNSCINSYLASARLFGNKVNSAFAFYYLSIHLKTVYRFREAKKYLSKAKTIADKYNDFLLLKNIREMGESIKKKNRDIPNYIAGETREKHS